VMKNCESFESLSPLFAQPTSPRCVYRRRGWISSSNCSAPPAQPRPAHVHTIARTAVERLAAAAGARAVAGLDEEAGHYAGRARRQARPHAVARQAHRWKITPS
jgi:hypothetical protein